MSAADDPGAAALADRYRTRLKDELARLTAASSETRDDRAPVELDQTSVGRLSRMDAMQQQAMAAAQDARRQGRVRAIHAALERLETGEFGWCDDCGEFIGWKRLDLDPTLTRCVDCAR
jgi:DnaK suppressor protein